MTETHAPERNWAGNYTYRAEKLHRPTTIEQVQEIVARAASIHVLGSRHSFNDIADSSELISLEDLPADVVVDHEAQTVSFGGGVKYGNLVKKLNDEGVALHTLASLPHISVAGAVATATHGSGVTCGNLGTAVAGLEIVTYSGESIKAARDDPDFDRQVVRPFTTFPHELHAEQRRRNPVGVPIPAPACHRSYRSHARARRRDATNPAGVRDSPGGRGSAVDEHELRGRLGRHPLHLEARARRGPGDGRPDRGCPYPVRGAPALGQGLPCGRSGNRSALQAPFRLRPSGGAARPARRVPQRMAEGPRAR